ncbi:MAG: thiamine pyrophosphate-binding protein [Candidatus Dadabacteria bacterium]|nr:thiamine pyrophosphate-binding protein [Candidatus Dadabacteria bacterium]
MARLQGGYLVSKALYDLGVRDIFTLGGGHINPVYRACTDLGIRLVDTHHEQGAAMAADAYGRLRRVPGVCLVTAGPGLTNALTGISGSYLANSPMILISGRSGIEENDRMSLQEIDQEAIVRPVTKWARTVYEAGRLFEYVSAAYGAAVSARPGPAYLGMSYEVLYPSYDESAASPPRTPIPDTDCEPPERKVSEFFRLLEKSKRPLIVIGSGGWYSGAEQSIAEFAERLKAPFFTLNMGRGILPDNHRCCFGAASPASPGGFREISAGADLVILLGVRLSIYAGFGNTINPRARTVQVDINPEEIGRNRPADLGIVCDLNSFLVKANLYLQDNKAGFDFALWMKEAHSLRSRATSAFRRTVTGSRGIHPSTVAKTVSDYLEGEGIIAVDGGDCQSWTDLSCEVKNPGHYLKGGPLGCMGVGIPFALGAKVAFPEKPVVLVSGDGAVAMNFMEMETAVRHSIPFVVVVCNDSAWGMTKHQIEITYPDAGETQGVDLGFVDFHEIVRAMGGYGEKIENIKDLTPGLERAFSSGLPAVLNVKTDPGAVSGATRVITEMMMRTMD